MLLNEISKSSFELAYHTLPTGHKHSALEPFAFQREAYEFDQQATFFALRGKFYQAEDYMTSQEFKNVRLKDILYADLVPLPSVSALTDRSAEMEALHRYSI